MADLLKAVLEELNDIPGVSARRGLRGGWHVELKWETGDPPNSRAALASLRAIEKSVKVVKSKLAVAEKQVRAQYTQAKAEATYRPGLGGILLGAKFRSGMRSAGAQRKEQLAKNRDKAMEPYARAKQSLDELLDRIAIEKARY